MSPPRKKKQDKTALLETLRRASSAVVVPKTPPPIDNSISEDDFKRGVYNSPEEMFEALDRVRPSQMAEKTRLDYPLPAADTIVSGGQEYRVGTPNAAALMKKNLLEATKQPGSVEAGGNTYRTGTEAETKQKIKTLLDPKLRAAAEIAEDRARAGGVIPAITARPRQPIMSGELTPLQKRLADAREHPASSVLELLAPALQARLQKATGDEQGYRDTLDIIKEGVNDSAFGAGVRSFESKAPLALENLGVYSMGAGLGGTVGAFLPGGLTPVGQAAYETVGGLFSVLGLGPIMQKGNDAAFKALVGDDAYDIITDVHASDEDKHKVAVAVGSALTNAIGMKADVSDITSLVALGKEIKSNVASSGAKVGIQRGLATEAGEKVLQNVIGAAGNTGTTLATEVIRNAVDPAYETDNIDVALNLAAGIGLPHLNRLGKKISSPGEAVANKIRERFGAAKTATAKGKEIPIEDVVPEGRDGYNAETAAKTLLDSVGIESSAENITKLLTDRKYLSTIGRRAGKKTHPDTHGGNVEANTNVNMAWRGLEKFHETGKMEDIGYKRVDETKNTVVPEPEPAKPKTKQVVAETPEPVEPVKETPKPAEVVPEKTPSETATKEPAEEIPLPAPEAPETIKEVPKTVVPETTPVKPKPVVTLGKMQPTPPHTPSSARPDLEPTTKIDEKTVGIPETPLDDVSKVAKSLGVSKEEAAARMKADGKPASYYLAGAISAPPGKIALPGDKRFEITDEVKNRPVLSGGGLGDPKGTAGYRPFDKPIDPSTGVLPVSSLPKSVQGDVQTPPWLLTPERAAQPATDLSLERMTTKEKDLPKLEERAKTVLNPPSDDVEKIRKTIPSARHFLEQLHHTIENDLGVTFSMYDLLPGSPDPITHLQRQAGTEFFGLPGRNNKVATASRVPFFASEDARQSGVSTTGPPARMNVIGTQQVKLPKNAEDPLLSNVQTPALYMAYLQSQALNDKHPVRMEDVVKAARSGANVVNAAGVLGKWKESFAATPQGQKVAGEHSAKGQARVREAAIDDAAEKAWGGLSPLEKSAFADSVESDLLVKSPRNAEINDITTGIAKGTFPQRFGFMSHVAEHHPDFLPLGAFRHTQNAFPLLGPHGDPYYGPDAGQLVGGTVYDQNNPNAVPAMVAGEPTHTGYEGQSLGATTGHLPPGISMAWKEIVPYLANATEWDGKVPKKFGPLLMDEENAKNGKVGGNNTWGTAKLRGSWFAPPATKAYVLARIQKAIQEIDDYEKRLGGEPITGTGVSPSLPSKNGSDVRGTAGGGGTRSGGGEGSEVASVPLGKSAALPVDTPRDVAGVRSGGIGGPEEHGLRTERGLSETSGNTAITRSGVSGPTRSLIDSGATKGKRVLHAGAGRADNPDRGALDVSSGDVYHYDPNHGNADRGPIGKSDFDVVHSPYVLNTLPPEIREQAIQDIKTSVKKNGSAVVAVRSRVDVESSKKDSWVPHQDGYLLKNKGEVNFQRGYTAQELRDELSPHFENVEIVSSPKQTTQAIVSGPKAETGVRFSKKPKKEKEPEKEPTFVRSDQELIDLAKGVEDWKDWYDKHEEQVLELFGPEYAPMFHGFLAATSASNGVRQNVIDALNAFDEWMSGKEFSSTFPAHLMNLERALKGEALKGPKVEQYWDAVTGGRHGVAIDTHLAQILFGHEPGSAPTAAMIRAGIKKVRELAAMLGWDAREVQAALWVANIIRKGIEPYRYEPFVKDNLARINELLSRGSLRGEDYLEIIHRRVEQVRQEKREQAAATKAANKLKAAAEAAAAKELAERSDGSGKSGDGTGETVETSGSQPTGGKKNAGKNNRSKKSGGDDGGTRSALRRLSNGENTGQLTKRNIREARRTKVRHDSRGPVLYLSGSDARLLGKYISEGEWTEVDIHPIRVAEELGKMKADVDVRIRNNVPYGSLEQLYDTLNYASDGGASGVTVIDASQPAAKVKADRLEGTGHRAVRDLITAPVVKAAKDHSAWETVERSLKEDGYEGDTLLAEEALVKIRAGKHEEIGLTEDEAADLEWDMRQAGIAAHGDAWKNAEDVGTRRYKDAKENEIVLRDDDADGAGDGGPERDAARGSSGERGEGGASEDVPSAELEGSSVPRTTDKLGRDLGRMRETYASRSAVERLSRITTSLGKDMDSLPDDVKHGLSTWAVKNSLGEGVIASKIPASSLQNELVKRGIAPPGKSGKPRAFSAWMDNTHADKDSPHKHLYLDSPYEMVRLSQLNKDENVASVTRAEKFEVQDPVTGGTFYYMPDFRIEYHNPSGGPNRVVYEEIKPESLASTPRVQTKERAAKIFLAKNDAKATYRIVSEAVMGPDLFRAAKDDTSLSAYVPAQSDKEVLQKRLESAAKQATRARSKANSGVRFSKKTEPEEDEPDFIDNLSTLNKSWMFLNPNTHITNVLSTGGFQVAEEVSKLASVPIDMTTVAVRRHLMGDKTAQRTVGNASLIAVARGLKSLAMKGGPEAWEVLKTGKVVDDVFEKYDSEGNPLKALGVDREWASKSKVLNAAINGPFRFMSAGDRLWKAYALTRSIEAQIPLTLSEEVATMRRNGQNVPKDYRRKRAAELRKLPTEAMTAEGVADAMAVTFNKDNLSSRLNTDVVAGLKKYDKTNLARLGWNSFFPIVRTPANVIWKILEYGAGMGIAPIRTGAHAVLRRGAAKRAVTAEGKAKLAASEKADLDARHEEELNELSGRHDEALKEQSKKKPNVIGHDAEGKPILDTTTLASDRADLKKSHTAERDALKEKQSTERKEAKSAQETAETDWKKAAETLADHTFSAKEQKAFAETFGRGMVGAGLIYIGYAMADAGIATGYSFGPGDAKDRKDVNAPANSIRLPNGKWINLQAIPPFGQLIAVGATLREKRAEYSGDAWKTSVSVAATVAKMAADVPQTRGINTYQDLTSGEAGKFQKAAGGMAAGYIPFQSALGTVANLTDSKNRSPQTFADAVNMKIPGRRQLVPESDRPKPFPFDPVKTIEGDEGAPDMAEERILRKRLAEADVKEQLLDYDPEDRGDMKERLLKRANKRYRSAKLATLEAYAEDKGWMKDDILNNDWNRRLSGYIRSLAKK